MEFKDYYAALGLSPDADEQTIKQAYRKLARQYHPGVNPGDTKAEERFEAISAAYQVLGDPQRRRKYDVLRRQYQQWQQRDGAGDFSWDQCRITPGERAYSHAVTREDRGATLDGDRFSDLFSSRFGQRGRPRRGRDVDVVVQISLEEAFRGATRTISLGERRVEARIPPGVCTGSRVRVDGQGEPGGAGGPCGDLYLVIEVAPSPQFERVGNDLTIDVPVDIYTAAAGGEARVPTLDGAVSLKIPPRTQAGQTFRLRGKGMPRVELPDERGDLYARVKLVLPQPLSDAELETLRALGRARQARLEG